MKLLFTAVFAFFSLLANAQSLPTDSTTGKIVYRGTLPLPAGVTQALAFGRAKIWMSDVAISKEELSDDAGSGLLNCRGATTVKEFIYTFRVRVQVEASRVKYRVDDFTWVTGSLRYPSDRGTPEEQRDSKMAMGRSSRAKILAELNDKIRAKLNTLNSELSGTL